MIKGSIQEEDITIGVAQRRTRLKPLSSSSSSSEESLSIYSSPLYIAQGAQLSYSVIT